jgi:hypothetical protein
MAHSLWVLDQDCNTIPNKLADAASDWIGFIIAGRIAASKISGDKNVKYYSFEEFRKSKQDESYENQKNNHNETVSCIFYMCWDLSYPWQCENSFGMDGSPARGK